MWPEGATLCVVQFRLISLLIAPLAVGACSSDGGSDEPVQLDASPTDVGFLDTGPSASDSGFEVADTGFADAGEVPCTYPDFANPMTVGQAIEPWTWARAIDAMDVSRGLSVRDVFCNQDGDMDWSPFDLLLFISIPAW